MMQKLIIVALQRGETMDDMISRQAAIDALCSVCGDDCDKSKFMYDGKQEDQVILRPEHYVLTQLPSEQPYEIHSDGRLLVTVDDIDNVNAVVVDESKSKFCKQFYLDAEPEITRCKDCIYWHSGSCEYPEHAVNCQDYMVGDIETEAEHFCGYAERREVTT